MEPVEKKTIVASNQPFNAETLRRTESRESTESKVLFQAVRMICFKQNPALLSGSKSNV